LKDQYVGDVNDYLKYALLRALAKQDEMGVVWMLTPDDARMDGQKLRYLTEPQKYRSVDPTLFDTLAKTVAGRRTVREIEASGLLPAVAFVNQYVPDAIDPRREYSQQALAACSAAPIVFFDPDNGLGVASVAKGRRNSSKYVYLDELRCAHDRGHSVIVYQHFPRREREAYLREVGQRIRVEIECPRVLALRTPFVAFVVIAQPEAEERLRADLEAFAVRSSTLRTAVGVY
jgi:hypothetical protein